MVVSILTEVITMKVFRIVGKYSPKGKEWFKFRKDLVAESEKEAREKSLSLLGSKYGIKRRLIKIEEIREIEPKESDDPVVKYYMRDENE